MPSYKLLCKYCGETFVEYIYKIEELERLRCRFCKDPNLKLVDETKGDYFGYLSDAPKEDAWIKRNKG